MESSIEMVLGWLDRPSTAQKCSTDSTCQGPSGSVPVPTAYKGAWEGLQGSRVCVLHRFFSTSPGAEGPHSWHQLPKAKATGNSRREKPSALQRPFVKSVGSWATVSSRSCQDSPDYHGLLQVSEFKGKGIPKQVLG